MNETFTKPSNENEFYAQADRAVRENPARSILIAAGVGLAIGVLIRALQPHPPMSRAERMMADIRHRLDDLGSRANTLANSGADLVHDGVDRVRGLHLDRRIRSLGDRVKSLFA
jgi:DUF883 C-terminal glycine zipper region